MDKKELLKQVWEKCTLQEILDAGYENEAIQAIDVLKEAEEIEKESRHVSLKVNFIENLADLFESTPSKDLPWAYEIMEEISNHYSDYDLMHYFDKADLIDHCDNSYEMDNYLNEKRKDIIEEYKNEHPAMGKDEFIRQVQDYSPYPFRLILCDLVDASYHISTDDLLQRLKEKL